MCVIVMKPIGAALPDTETLFDCWEENPDGAGFAVSSFECDKPYYEKGFMTFESFMDAVSWYDVTSNALVLHFRIATHGGVIPGHTHPFPLVTDIDAMRELKGDHECIIAHNGIFKIASPASHSDTMQAISEMGSDPVKWWANNPQITTGSRMAVLFGHGEYKLLGTWETEDGIFYSNLNHCYKNVYPSFTETVKANPSQDEIADYYDSIDYAADPEEYREWWTNHLDRDLLKR